MNRKDSPGGWPLVALGDIISLEYGRSFPENERKPGPYAVYGSNGLVGRAHKYLIEERTVIVGRKGSAGEINYAEPKSWPIDTTYYLQLKDAKVLSIDFVYYLLKWVDPRRFIDTTTKPGLNRDRLYEQVVPLPPLPVQERLVQILQKADEVRNKRVQALDIADSTLRAAFISMFGDPGQTPNAYEVIPLGELADIRSGVTKGRRLGDRQTVEAPYLRVANVQDGYLDLTDMKTIEVLPEDIDKYHLEDGDILMTEGGDPDKLGRGCVWREQIKGCIHQNHVFRVRTDRARLAPEYLAALLRTQYAKHYFLSCAKRTSNLASVNKTQVSAFKVPAPPIALQMKFVSAVEQWRQTEARLAAARKDAESMFSGLFHHAFTGALTAQWEASNAEAIASQQVLHECLPRLLVLALLVEKVKRASRAAAEVLVTALMKYTFLLQMEGNGGRRRLYHFVPYHYGPFAKELYADLEKLQGEGLVRVDNDSEEDKTKITVVDPAKADEVLANLPDDLREDAATIIETYGDLDHKALLKIVYERFPAYAKKSRPRQRRGADRHKKPRGQKERP